MSTEPTRVGVRARRIRLDRFTACVMDMENHEVVDGLVESMSREERVWLVGKLAESNAREEIQNALLLT